MEGCCSVGALMMMSVIFGMFVGLILGLYKRYRRKE